MDSFEDRAKDILINMCQNVFGTVFLYTPFSFDNLIL